MWIVLLILDYRIQVCVAMKRDVGGHLGYLISMLLPFCILASCAGLMLIGEWEFVNDIA